MPNLLNRFPKRANPPLSKAALISELLSRWWKLFAAAAAMLGVITGAIKNWDDLADKWKKKWTDPVIWPAGLMVSIVDAESYDAALCLLDNAPRSDLFLHLDEGNIPLGKEACAEKLYAAIAEGRGAGEERLRKASFLFVKYTGSVSIAKFEIKMSDNRSITYGNVINGRSFATCVKFEGKAGYPGYGSDLTQITATLQGTDKAASLDADAFKKSPTPLPASKGCQNVYMGYPK